METDAPTPPPRPQADRRQLQQIIAGLSEGVMLIDPDRSIVWANETALAIHQIDDVAGLGGATSEYRKMRHSCRASDFIR